MSTSKRKVLVIGLDSATFDLLKPWMTDGCLPVLSTLVRDGASGELRSTLPPHTAPAWSSFMTGKNPGKHGVFGLMKLSPDHDRLELVSATDRKAKDLWEIMSDFGKSVVVLSVPITYPVRPVNGILVSGFMTPPSAEDSVYPLSVKDELRQAVGESKPMVEKDLDRSLLDSLFRNLEADARTASYFLKRQKWDFFMFVIQGTDEIQHRFWHLMDPRHPQHDPMKAAKYGGAILEYYERVDRILGQILTETDTQETTLVVLSDHGARPLHNWISLNNIFWRNGLLVFKKDLATRMKLLLFRIGVAPINLYRTVLKLHLTDLRRSIQKEETRATLRPLFISLRDVDWSSTRVYSLGGWGQIYINRNVVTVGDYEKVRNSIIELLLATKDPNTGESIFNRENIHFREEVYHGPFLDEAPDVIALPNPPYQGYPDYEFGFNSVVMEGVGISGTHAMNGIILMKGPTIKVGASLGNPLIADVAPTILYLMGLEIPEDMDGKVITDAIQESHLASNPPRYKNRTAQITTAVSHGYSAQEEERIRKVLRDLGYL